MSLRTLHLTNAWHGTSGGIGTFYRSLLAAAEEVGHSIRLVVPSESNGIEDIGQFGRIYHLRSARAPVNRNYRLMYPGHYLFPSGRIPAILNAERPHLIEICDKYTLPYLGGLLRVHKLKGVDFQAPVVGLSCERMDENMIAYLSGSALGKRFSRWYMKNIYFPQFDYHVANSEHTAEELRAASRGHKVRRGVWVRPMGVDCACFSPALRSAEFRRELARSAGGTESSVLLLYAGRLVPEKNLGLLTATVAELSKDATRDYRLFIAGQGMSRSAFERACHQHAPGRVRFLDHIADRAALARLYASCDIFVHPNPREPFGIAPLEGMASALALVAPDVGGITSYANSLNSWPARPDARSFAAQIIAVDADQERRRLKIASAIETAAAYDWSVICRSFLNLYAAMVDPFRADSSSAVREPQFYSTQGDYWGREIEVGQAPV